MILVISTVDNYLSLGLKNENTFIEKFLFLPKQVSQNSVDVLNSLLLENSYSLDDIKEIVVVSGPGSYTGVKIGVVIAKTIGLFKDVKIIALNLLDVMLNYDNDALCLYDCRNGNYFAYAKDLEKNFYEASFMDDYLKKTNKKILGVEAFLKNPLFDEIFEIRAIYILNAKHLGKVVSAKQLLPDYMRKTDAERNKI